jgi:hypothetical protein
LTKKKYDGIFCSDIGLLVLSASKRWHVDGTFDTQLNQDFCIFGYKYFPVFTSTVLNDFRKKKIFDF